MHGWRRLAGRELFRVIAGDGWLELRLVGEDRRGLFLAARAGATLLFDIDGPLPRELRNVLPAGPRLAAAGHLDGARIEGAGILDNDLVATLRLQGRDGAPRFLLIQLFGSRGNVVVLDEGARVLWALHRPLHPVLTSVPSPEIWTAAPADSPATTSAARPAGQTVKRGGGRVARRFRVLGLQHLARQMERDLATRLVARVRQRLKQQERLLTNLDRDFATADAGESVRRDAEALAANLHLWRRGLAQLEVVDPQDGRPRTIALDPARDGPTNLDGLFKRARRAERGRQQIFDRRREAQARLAELMEAERTLAEAVAVAPASVTDPDAEADLARLQALAAWESATTSLVAPPRRRGAPTPEAPTRPFRRYRIANKWEVWIGRSSAENDELTHRHAALRDLWLHAQGVTGSHVILRTGGKPEQVPKQVIAKAAALAAQHSKSRHSGIVPVMVAQRRYVRKPRKSLPGTATCLQYETIFVEPGIPDDAEPI